jgi:CubicO group peptidase (beta-lactamase class C family)
MPLVTRRQLLAGVGLGVAGATAAPGTAESGPPADQSAAAARTQQTVESVVDDLVETALDEHSVPGATVAVVADDTVFTKGYGVADRERGTAVDPANTRFRIGSVSKPVVWTALARLLTRGTLDPTEPVSTYLDGVTLDTRYGAPTTAQLATHRSGFESSNRGLWIENADRLGSLSDTLRSAQPAVVRPPGEAASYSNYGAALAGGVLADVVGESFDDAIDDLLLGPAGMTASSFAQPPPESVAENHATGHAPGLTFRDGQFPYVGLRPAGSLSATADDMARFLQLHLNDGVVDGERVLASETVELLHRQWATAHEAMPGLTFGFVERYHDGTRTLWHNGSTISFHSDLVLVPEAGLGLFVSFNGSGGTQARGDVREGVLDAFLSDAEANADGTAETTGGGTDEASGGDAGGVTTGEGPTADGRPTRADELAGTYRSLRVSETGHDRLPTTVQAPTVRVSVAEGGVLVTESGGTTSRWVERGPLLFEHVESGRLLAFDERDGAVGYLAFGSSPTTAFGRIGVGDRLDTHLAVAVVGLLGMLSGVLGWPVAALVRRFRGGARIGYADRLRAWRDHPALLARVVAGGAGVALVGFVLLVVGHFAVQPLAVLSAPPVTFRALFALPTLGVLATAVAGGLVALAWRETGVEVGRVHETVVVASLAAVCWLLAYWNLLVPP